MPGISWTKEWTNSNDGEVIHGNDLGNIQSDIDNSVPTKSGTEEIDGDWTFSGVVTFSGTHNIYDLSRAVCYENNVVCYENEIVYY